MCDIKRSLCNGLKFHTYLRVIINNATINCKQYTIIINFYWKVLKKIFEYSTIV